ncbi:alpha/beta hydrolase [Nocardioides panzhihuensis]|uniref:Pimeloyl-ACP methyl ester carboxylesterase n=1 Tax=Nocardioides panzhihuensis TaxID=860243 RepID=A0A7Z0IUT7_9ACTN|nr:alpha/beta hydrolase [Nocardioides panzhihuensis]NYI80287.1 pimeloyl-ACP methyl ester carboxylesterase [Nocardioides panzhihuensis]
MRSVKGVAAGAAVVGMLVTGCGAEGRAGDPVEASASVPVLPSDGPYIEGELGGCFLPETDVGVEPMRVSGAALELPAIRFSPPADQETSAVLVMLHQTDGDRCGWGDFAILAAHQGVAGLSFDLCGYGAAECGIKDVDDPVPQVRAALSEVEKEWPGKPVVLVGASMGGSQTVRAVAAGLDVDGWVDLSGPSRWGGVDLAAVADRVRTPGLIVISEDTDGPEEAAAARALAEATSSKFVPAEAGHGWDLVVEEGRLSTIGQQVVAYAVR